MNAPERPSGDPTNRDKTVFETEQYLTDSHEQTAQVGRRFAARLTPGDWVGLTGPLGAGKSVFARAVGHAWGVSTVMPSPSYTLMNSHQGRCAIHHIDLYRVGSPDELDFAGLTQYFDGPGICLVEWPERARSLWPDRGWIVTLNITGSGTRRISIGRFEAGK